ncbi:DegT/DnrJ/EryC1/StrS family aminotransferase [Oceanithermus desulfurans]|uniref:Aminotransferase n=2 Tax=Oceanithermus desulfurans TaxID=227924 RepID=A0A511RM94_9DEIN|nr:DegT/DnrJ/EryC1/StrS family aminotransferase [Oceanithermus desulfurans]MBB6030461.1 dTDP-4-amino-4,6-dideoxygalactose transaminase [Oceanithermus desulfurans]GEM90769.1 aminotransferase [Oceanithermus desulfurans NBRC 100063]
MSKIEIPIYDPRPEIAALRDEIDAAIRRVVDSGRFILGPEVEAFEEEVADYLGVRHAVGLNSGTDALVIGLRVLGVGPGDEVITTPFTFFATAEAISLVGAKPVFVDIDPRTFNIDPELIPAALTERTRAIVPVHLYGQAADMDPILAIAKEHGLKVLEDTAQAFGGEYKGRKLGTLGDAGAFSFFPTKNLGGFGDGGLLATNDDEVAEMARMLRAHGAKKKYQNEILGYNSRLDALQAAVLRVKLRHVDAFNQARRELAHAYTARLDELAGVTPPHEAPYGVHVYHQYTVRVADGKRDVVAAGLAERGVGTMVYYPTPLHQLPVCDYAECTFPEAEQAAREVLSLPMSPHISVGQIERVVRKAEEFLVRL